MTSATRMINFFTVFILVGLHIFSGDAGHISEICGRTKCNGGSLGKFKYTVGTIYRYYHKVDVNVNLGNGSSTSDLHIESIVTLKFTTPCEADLQISKASIRHATRGKYDAEFPDRAETEFKDRLERYSLRFTFEDGHVHELCPNSDDAIWAVNIKRGVLSMLQNTMKRFDVDHHAQELDVNGICDTRYRLHEARKTSLIILKTKDLYGCTNRGKHLSIIQSNIYASPPTRSQATLLDSKINCEIVIDHNIYEKVTCEEIHRLQPLSTGDSAIKANTFSSLNLIEESQEGDDRTNEMNIDDNDTDSDDEDNGEDQSEKSTFIEIIPTNLLYDHAAAAFSSRTVHGELRTSRDLLKSMCTLGTSGRLEQSFSETFSKFVHSARFLDYPSLSQLLARADSICTGGRTYILDALPFISTSAAIKVMCDAILKKSVNREKSESWMTAIALAPRPDSSTVAALLPLLESNHENYYGKFNLIYSAVIRAFCLNAATTMAGQRTRSNFFHEDNCLAIKGTGIDRFLDHLESTIERGCEPRPHDLENVKRTLEALKAIGNMGLEREGLSEKLERCIDNTGGFISMETRVAAIDAHRRLPSCQGTRDRLFLPRYRNVTLEPEIRIASYLQAMRCPDYNVVKTIKLTLKEEPINQVGSFVWSHLTNLLASSSPTRIEIQSLLSDRDISDKFNSDARKYSRNYEKSFFSEEYNVGGTFQANIIFSPKSYVPRTITFNVSLDLFGESVNVLECSMRMEGMEYYAEKFFGPNGPLANEKISRHIISFLRSLRSADDAKNYWEALNILPNVIDNNFDDPRVSISYKIFGNELEYVMLRGPNEITESLAALDPWQKIKRILSGKEIHYEHNGMFLDVSYVVPSTTGLPVRLDLDGSAACKFKFSGLLDSERLIKDTEIELVGNLAPSVSIAVTGKMTIDAFYKSAAIKLRSNVYSSSAAKLRLDIKGMKLVRLNLELPNRKLEVFTIRSDVVLLNGNGAETLESPAIPSALIPIKYGTIANSTCSWPVIERLIGLKLCFDYQFPNVTEVTNASYFFLNGPTLFRTSVIKADPSAQSYLFEYSWNATATYSVFKLAFDTLGSHINRESSVIVTFDARNRNVSVLLRSAGNSLVAEGTYKRTDNETMINVGLDVNGTKHLNGYIGYVKKRGSFGFTYTPKLELRVNNEIIIELSGIIRDARKNNVSQCDIDLNFRTKKITSKVIGYVMRRDISITGNVKVDYQLRSMKRETLQIEISLVNRSSKTLMHKEANLKLQSSAYPHLNAVIETWYQQALGHLELHAEINTKPHLQDDRHKLIAQLVLTYSKAYFQSQEAKMNAFIAIRKPIQNLDIKVGIQRFSVGPSSKTYFLIRYAPGKEISLAVNVVMPRSSTLAIEGHANMTIPNFDSMLIDIRITEKRRGEYDLDLAGTWFSGHNATIRGTYADRSSIIGERCIISHNLKLILRSPSLARDILLNCKMYRDHINTKFDIDVEYLNADKYALKFDHSIITPVQFISHAEARYKSNVYAVTANVDIEHELRLELHLDNWRDIHLIATGINKDTTKEFGIEVKWDANRDPALKFATLFQLNKFFESEPFISQNYSAAIMITYPGRLFTVSCLIGMINGHNYILEAHIDWDPTKTIRFVIDADYDAINWKNYFKFDSRLLTPFEQWKKTSLNARYHWTNQELTANCDANWQDNQQFSIQFAASTHETVSMIEWRANCGLTSTVHSIGWINANLTHKMIRQSSDVMVDTRMLVNYNPDKVIDVKSIWHVKGPSKPDDNITLAGNLRFISPLTNYQNGDIKCQLRLMNNWKFDGITNIEMDKRRYTGVLRGDLVRIRESMVEFNVTTPLEKYSFLRGRFGLSEQNKHAVAEIVLPSGPIGVEAICRLFTTATYDFNVMLRISTHIEVLQKFLVIAKLAKTEADFRLAYNNATVGLTAIWHYNNLTDLHYSYVLYTPIHGLHESGIVAKLIILECENAPSNWLAVTIDTEFTIRIVETKFGVQAKAGPKLSPFQMLDDKLVESSFSPESDDFNWRGDIEVNTAIFEPIIGSLDLDKRGALYQLNGYLQIPQGTITVDDNFIFVDFFNMKNILEIKTPFVSFGEINYTYIFNIDMETSIYLLEMKLNVRKNDSTPLLDNTVKVNYTYSEGDEDDSQTHMIHLTLETPKGFLGDLYIHGFLEFDETIYKTNIALRMNESQADFSGSFEMEEAFLDGSLTVYIISPALMIPKIRINIKKDFTEVEKRLEFGIQMLEVERKKCKFHAVWNIESEHHAKIFLNIETWIKLIQLIEVDLTYDNNLFHNQSLEIQIKLTHFPGQEYKLSGAFHPNRTIDIDLRGPENIEGVDYRFDGVLDESNKLTGYLINLRTSMIYIVNSTIEISTRQDKIAKIDGNMIITQKISEKDGNSKPRIITFIFYHENYEINLNIRSDAVNSTASLNYINILNWKTNLNMEYPELRLDSEYEKKKYVIEAYSNVNVNGSTSMYLNAKTPWVELGNVQLDGNLMVADNGGNIKINHHLNNDSVRFNFAWKLVFLEDMLLKISGTTNDKDVGIIFFFKNPRRTFTNINCGYDINVDDEVWRCTTNMSIGFKNKENIDAVLTFRLPPPNNDEHRVLVTYHANKGLQNATFAIGYNAAKAMINYASEGSIRIAERDMNAHLRFIYGTMKTQFINNILNVTFDQKRIGFKYLLFTPKFDNEETATICLNYDGTLIKQSFLDIDLHYPAHKQIGTAHISYMSLSNVNGTLNITTFFPQFPYAACEFIVLTTLKQNKRYVKVLWSNDTALLNSDYSYHSERLDSNLEGIVQLEIPLNTRHTAELNYGYKKRPQVTVGHADLVYNKNKILIAHYDSKGESRAGFEKDSIQITIENSFEPLGITYVNQYEYSAGNAGTNYPTIEWRRVNVYRLDNRTAFNVAGESRVKTFHEGQEIELKAEHFNRTVRLRTDYHILPGEFDHNCWIALADDAWASYKLNIINKTTDELENQFVIINVAYPWRNFSLDGSYRITKCELSSEAKLTWNQTHDINDFDTTYNNNLRINQRERTIGAAFIWMNTTEVNEFADRQMAMLSLKHPHLSKDATIMGYFERKHEQVLLNASVTIDYSENPDKLFGLSTIIRNETQPNHLRYYYTISGKHLRTHLDLAINGYLEKKTSNFIRMDHRAAYRRSYLPEETGQLFARLDSKNYELEYHRQSNELTKHLNLAYYPFSPEYVVNGTIIDTPKNLNATGAFYLNIPEKLTWIMVNYTPDSVESLRMYGNIPDARNGVLDIWRTYERNLIISDVSFYLRLNHSRLVTSILKWRPNLREDITDMIKTTISDVYSDIGKNIDYWKHYVRSETINALCNVWDDAREDLSVLVDDWNNLRELDADLERLKIYLNDSYNANDFYIKDVVAIGIYVIDELALRTHIESLPNILNEIWEIMGESGEAIRNSLLWIIEATKNAYQKLSEIVSAILKGESIAQIASIVEQIVEQYDKFVKDLHVSFIKYVESLWAKFSLAVSRQWDKTLKMIEPIFIRILHYLEAVLWKASREVVDFLYDRRNELIKSPYFDRFTNFTQDVDKLYRDIKGNDIITNIRKYSTILINFIRERYFTMVPFGNELKDLVDEILSELAELKKLPSVNYALQKINYVYERINYFYEYFGVQAKIESAARLIHSKLIDISQTALQAESKYRDAKTKFIFDPNIGLMCLEQKLPMSWHAFNQTPEFQEIPEYRAIIDIRNYFSTSNATFWTLYYRYRPYTDPYNWLPPFKAQAMIVGSQHFITFDGRHFDFVGTGTYLLARDFVHNHFAILISYSTQSTQTNSSMNHKIIVSIGRQSLQVDMFNDRVQFAESEDILQLPVELENGVGFVYQEDTIVTIELKKNQFKLKCNLKYDVCVIELSGWFYGKTAGLLGTMNNERWDDTLASDSEVKNDIVTFAESWLVVHHGKNHPNERKATNLAHIGNINPDTEEFCDNLFSNKSSEFGSCFMVVEPQFYADACKNVRSMSEACSLTMAYMQICGFYETYLRIPDKCTACPMTNGTLVPEGEFRTLEKSSVPNSTDVVFIVEAKVCNANIRQNRSIDQIVNHLNKELNDRGLKNNRWALVIFGGYGAYDIPRSLILDSAIFTNDTLRFLNYFNNIHVGDGNQDIFAAIGFASELVFRAGVSKTFILMPCSHCEPQNQTLDYSVLHEVLLEHDITLHILMDGDFNFKKQRLSKMFFGIDATKSYTRKDAKILTGDMDLRRQVKLPKSALGYCTPLSLETNGTIFSANKLTSDKTTSIKKFTSVFAKRVALTAEPSPCQYCECTADNDGVTHMECLPCIYPMPASVDYVSEIFNEDDAIALSLDDNTEIDIDDD